MTETAIHHGTTAGILVNGGEIDLETLETEVGEIIIIDEVQVEIVAIGGATVEIVAVIALGRGGGAILASIGAAMPTDAVTARLQRQQIPANAADPGPTTHLAGEDLHLYQLSVCMTNQCTFHPPLQ